MDQQELAAYIGREGGIPDSLEVSQKEGWTHDKVVGAIKSLQSLGYVTTVPKENKSWVLTDEGTSCMEKGSPEFQVLQAVLGASGITTEGLDAQVGADVAKIGMGKAMQNKWLEMDRSQKPPMVTAKVTDAQDILKQQLAKIQELGGDVDAVKGALGKTVDDLKKRKMIVEKKITSFKVEKTDEFKTEIKKDATDLTADMLKGDKWKAETFKEYNLTALGAGLQGGHLHPLLKVRTEIRNMLTLMGFEEMPTNRWVESSFWNFDTLFQPQQHPARDAHDTFFITEPARTVNIEKDYLERVKTMHESGGAGSIGWRYNWSEDESRKNILRTHTTAVSSRMLKLCADEYKKTGVFKPKRCFSIDRVFRNETLDATHLAEFHQVEGFVCDRGLTLGHLIGVIREFFRRMGLIKLRFKPAYNPYTEPSMEIFAFHPVLNKWIEIGNSGVFRPEMLRPMGLPEDVSCIAWGLGLERATVIKYGISHIRELSGHKLNVVDQKKNPVAWYGKVTEEGTTA